MGTFKCFRRSLYERQSFKKYKQNFPKIYAEAAEAKGERGKKDGTNAEKNTQKNKKNNQKHRVVEEEHGEDPELNYQGNNYALNCRSQRVKSKLEGTAGDKKMENEEQAYFSSTVSSPPVGIADHCIL